MKVEQVAEEEEKTEMEENLPGEVLEVDTVKMLMLVQKQTPS